MLLSSNKLENQTKKNKNVLKITAKKITKCRKIFFIKNVTFFTEENKKKEDTNILTNYL